MRKLVFFPSEPIVSYIEKGRTYEFLDEYYNPGGYFDEVYCLSPWGEKEEEIIGNTHYIKASPVRFAKIIKKIKPDVIRGYGGYCCADWISISKVKNVPTIVSVHDTNPDLIFDSLKYADAIICMSSIVKEAIFEKVKINTNQVWVMPNRIDIDLFSPVSDEIFFGQLNQRFGNGKHILHIGRKTEQKNIDTVIKALKYLSEDITCIFVGRGDSKIYQALAQSEGVLERCHFIERIPNQELPLWYSWCDCFCTPSRWEGFGYVFIEAAACETAIVTSNIAPMNEYLTNGKDSILVDDYENPEKIAQAILKAISDTESNHIMKKNARMISLKFEKSLVDDQEMDIYKKVIDGPVNNNKNYLFLVKYICGQGIFRVKKVIKRVIHYD